MLIFSNDEKSSGSSAPSALFTDNNLEALFAKLARIVGSPADSQITISKEPCDNSFFALAREGIVEVMERDQLITFKAEMPIRKTELLRRIRIEFLSSKPGVRNWTTGFTYDAKDSRFSRSLSYRTSWKQMNYIGQHAERSVRTIADRIPHRTSTSITWFQAALLNPASLPIPSHQLTSRSTVQPHP